ncbi:MAG TPA: hypothetical protein VFP10_09010 [Candidatus Eisenbacteria bacterium]|nr:hypothetical protein [Candidatus Eisenbacteria bacterium]
MPESGEFLAWSVRPVSRARALGVAAASVIVLTVFSVWFVAGPFMGLLSLLVLAGGCGPFFTRTRYRLTPDEVQVDSPFLRVKRPWSAFRRAYVGRDGVSLSPFAGRHVLEPYRSVMLRYGSERDEILNWVRRFGPKEPA